MKHYGIWSPERGIVKQIHAELVRDIDGLARQMRGWTRSWKKHGPNDIATMDALHNFCMEYARERGSYG